VLESSPLQVTQIDAFRIDIFGRRGLFVVLFAATMAGSLALAALALSPGGFGMIDITLLVLFAVTLPWMVAGFWNAVIGFLIMHFVADPMVTATEEEHARTKRKANPARTNWCHSNKAQQFESVASSAGTVRTVRTAERARLPQAIEASSPPGNG